MVISGAAINSATTNRDNPINGSTETIISRMVVWSGAAPFATNNKRPKGGVARLISIMSSDRTPNQTISNPMASTSGMHKGIVIMIMLTWSMKHPRSIRSPKIPRRIRKGERSESRIRLNKPTEASEKARI